MVSVEWFHWFQIRAILLLVSYAGMSNKTSPLQALQSKEVLHSQDES